MRVLVDTTYLLPAVGVSVKGVPEDVLLRLLDAGHRVYISEIAVFELSAKCAKYIVEGTLGVDKVCTGVRSLVYDERIGKIRLYDTSVMRVAFRLRRLLSDFIDCLVTGSAVSACDVLLTEDEDIHGLRGRERFQGILGDVNPTFRVYSAKEFERKPADRQV